MAGAAASVPPVAAATILAQVRTSVPSRLPVARRVVGCSVCPPLGLLRTTVVSESSVTPRVPEVLPSLPGRVLRTMLLDVRPSTGTTIWFIVLGGCRHRGHCESDGEGQCSESAHGFLQS